MFRITNSTKIIKGVPNTIKAKTGNMSGITCLCGYSLTQHNPKAFVFMSNSFAPPSKEMFEEEKRSKDLMV